MHRLLQRLGTCKNSRNIWWRRLCALGRRRLHKFIYFQGRGHCSQIADRVLPASGGEPPSGQFGRSLLFFLIPSIIHQLGTLVKFLHNTHRIRCWMLVKLNMIRNFNYAPRFLIIACLK